jgi:cell division protein FtsI/penicillin-binding protein 2
MDEFRFWQKQKLYLQVPEKAHRVLLFLLGILLFILLRLWYVAAEVHESAKEEFNKTRKKSSITSAERGTIRDRFGLLLAGNTTDFRVSIVWSEMKDIPQTFVDKSGKRRPLRKEYIKKLSELLSNELLLDPLVIEDQIHSHAALWDTVPFIIKSGLNEEEYYRLKFLEKDYPGLSVERIPRRIYPFKKTGCHAVGYLGKMPKASYDSIIMEKHKLSEYLKEAERGLDIEPPEELNIGSFFEAKRRYIDLEEKAYSLADACGITGVEAAFEGELRGFWGKRNFLADAKGQFVKELPGFRPPISGKRVILSLSIELQEFCEQLLALSEKERAQKSRATNVNEPAIRGGAIVAVEPLTGSVVALASFPRFDPNDFSSPDREKKARWVESEGYIAKVWDGTLPLFREHYVGQKFKTEETFLSWQQFLDLIVPPTSGIFEILKEDAPLHTVFDALCAFEDLQKRALQISPKELVELLEQKGEDSFPDNREEVKILCRFFSPLEASKEKLLALDLSHLLIFPEECTKELRENIGDFTIGEWRRLSIEASSFKNEIRKECRKSFHDNEFRKWRREHEKGYLADIRKIEREKHRAPQPYLELLQRQEKIQFDAFWKKHHASLLAAKLLEKKKPEFLYEQALKIDPSYLLPFLEALKTYDDHTWELLCHYEGLGGTQGKNLIATFLRAWGASPLRSFAFGVPQAQGSIFKLVTAYAGLKQRYEEGGATSLSDLSLQKIEDRTFTLQNNTYVGSFLDGRPIPQLYKGGRIPKSLHHAIGRCDLFRAIEYSSNPYFSLLAAEYLHSPDQLLEAARDFGYGKKTGIMLPSEAAGNLPDDIRSNRTGLYAFAIGQHTLLTTPLQTAMMLSAISNGGKLLCPNIVHLVAGRDLDIGRAIKAKGGKFPYQQDLLRLGIAFPLFLPPIAETGDAEITEYEPQVNGEIFLPPLVREALYEGMGRAIGRLYGDEKTERLKISNPKMYRDFLLQKGHFFGKSSTAEIIERVGITFSPPPLSSHVWFGAIAEEGKAFSFHDDFGKEELVVVVYLRFGGYGKEAAPLAAAVCEKWREIKKEHAAPQ